VEKESAVGQHQTGNNSGVLHCGLAYRPGSNKANWRCAHPADGGVLPGAFDPHDICGKLVVATREEQLPRLKDLFQRGTQNGLLGLEILDGRGCGRSNRTPRRGRAASSEEGIVDYPAVCEALRSEIEARGGKVATSAGVTGLRRNAQEWRVETRAGDFAADVVVTCAVCSGPRRRLAASTRTCRSCPSAATIISCGRSANFWCAISSTRWRTRSFLFWACTSRG